MSDPADLDLLVSVIIVSFNTRDLTLECLRALEPELTDIAAEIIVVDNASADGSSEAIRAAFPGTIVIENVRNAGFGAANNLAMAQARGKFWLLLNTDAFLRPGALRELLALLECDAGIGVAGPRTLNRDGSLQRSCFRFPTPRQAWLENLWLSRLFHTHAVLGDYREWPHDEVREVDWVIGACMLVRRDAARSAGGFDERFFLYQEEADWQLRIRRAGWRVIFTPAAQVVHYGGESGRAEPVQINRHFFESLDRFVLKHHGRVGFLLLRAAMLVGCTMRAVLWTVNALVNPSRRERSAGKARKHAQLVLRQLSTGRPA